MESGKRIEHVRSFFEHPERYLKDNFNIRIRAETVSHFAGNSSSQSILDIGCGNGAISLPLLGHNNKLTLLDVSENMLQRARAAVPGPSAQRVQFVNADFMLASLQPRSYDLILCLGVLAHTDSPIPLIAKMRSLLRPGGSVIVQNTDGGHPVRFLVDVWVRLRTGLTPGTYTMRERGYRVNYFNHSVIVKAFAFEGLRLCNVYRYNDQFPGIARVFGPERAYRWIRWIYGTAGHNRCPWLGQECIYHFRETAQTCSEIGT